MRKLLILLAAVCLTTALAAQSKVSKKEIEKATNEVAVRYQLTPEQKAKMSKIQERRLTNLQEVEKIKSTDYENYLRKRATVRIATENHIKRMLTEEQTKIYQVQIAERRKRESEKLKDLKRQGATKEQIELGLLEIE